MKKIGILGGMGPEATILLQQRLLSSVVVQGDEGHIPLLIDMNPQVPSRLTWILDKQGADPGPVLASMAESLQAHGAQAIAMPCNTAHMFAPQIEQAISLPFLNMPKLAALQTSQCVGAQSTVGILASPATKETKLFEQLFEEHRCRVLFPDDMSNLLDIIKSVKAIGSSVASVEALQAEADKLVDNGADCLLIGCSEFSLLAESITSPVLLVDSLDILVKEIVLLSTS